MESIDEYYSKQIPEQEYIEMCANLQTLYKFFKAYQSAWKPRYIHNYPSVDVHDLIFIIDRDRYTWKFAFLLLLFIFFVHVWVVNNPSAPF